MRRFLSLAAFIVLVSTIPALAAMPSSQTTPSTAGSSNTQQRFGTAMCSPKVPCEGDSASVSYPYADVANKCIVDNFSLAAPSYGFFSNEILDSSNCLNGKVNASAGGAGRTQVAPKCCLTQLPDNSCALHCELLTQ